MEHIFINPTTHSAIHLLATYSIYNTDDSLGNKTDDPPPTHFDEVYPSLGEMVYWNWCACYKEIRSKLWDLLGGAQIVSSGQFIKRGGKLFQLKEAFPTGKKLDVEADAEVIWNLPGQFKSHHIKSWSGVSTF